MKIVVLAALLTLSACSSFDRETEVLLYEGYTEIRFDGEIYTGCEDGSSHTAFHARSPEGRLVGGVVCCRQTGFGKVCTMWLQ